MRPTSHSITSAWLLRRNPAVGRDSALQCRVDQDGFLHVGLPLSRLTLRVQQQAQIEQHVRIIGVDLQQLVVEADGRLRIFSRVENGEVE